MTYYGAALWDMRCAMQFFRVWTLIATNLSGLICGSFAIECHRLLPMNQKHTVRVSGQSFPTQRSLLCGKMCFQIHFRHVRIKCWKLWMSEPVWVPSRLSLGKWGILASARVCMFPGLRNNCNRNYKSSMISEGTAGLTIFCLIFDYSGAVFAHKKRSISRNLV